ncbi:MAG TPA: RNA 3'-terminal phosphate cyclase [Nitrososphaerales archaeon]|nr:RNA 3'-terminal phosphate cyclase [Nitrososphaerales archaeon]
MQAIEIDGSAGEGGGQILRTSLTLAAVFCKPIRITRIRAGRKEPGLKPQHLQSVLAATRICEGKVRGASVGSTEIEFLPGRLPKKFNGLLDTGTAGSISLIAQTILPISIFGGVDLDVEIRGGTEVPNAPTIDYVIKLMIPVYRNLGAEVDLRLRRRGYYPKGGGSVILRTSKPEISNPIDFVSDEVAKSSILSVSRRLPEHVAKRQAESAQQLLGKGGIDVSSTELDSAGDSLSPGSSILIYQVTCSRFIGASSLGQKGKKAELVGEEAAENFAKELSYKPSVDSHLADMLVTLLSCVPGKSQFKTSFLTSHFLTNCEVAKKLAGCDIQTQKSGEAFLVEIVGSPEKPN